MQDEHVLLGIFEEYLDTWRLSDDKSRLALALDTKYFQRTFDVVVADGPAVFELLLRNPPKFPHGTPLVFLTVTDNLGGSVVEAVNGSSVCLRGSLAPVAQAQPLSNLWMWWSGHGVGFVPVMSLKIICRLHVSANSLNSLQRKEPGCPGSRVS